MSVIIENSGLLTILQSLNKKGSDEHFVYNGACDRLAFQMVNQLVGNPPDALTLEMTVQPAVIKFTEPTIVAFSGADFSGTTNSRTIDTNRIYLFDKGDTVRFDSQKRGNRLYMAVAGGMETEKTNVLSSGDELLMKREYTPQHHELFNILRQNNTVNWGVDYYALVEVYIPDVFHIVRVPGVASEVYANLERGMYTVMKEKNRVSVYLKGDDIDLPDDDIETHGVLGGVYIAENQPVITLNDFNHPTTAPHIGTIPSYHMHKLAQKRPGSHIQFKCIEVEDAHANLYAHHLWMQSLFKAINYKLSKEMVREKL